MAKSAQKPVTAFVVMDAAPGEAHNVVKYLQKYAKKGDGPQKGAYVKAAWVVSGDHDVVAMTEADTNSELLQMVTTIVRGSGNKKRGDNCSCGTITGTTTMFSADGMWG